MATANKTIGTTIENDRDDSVTKEDYSAPTLTVVGTVADVTLGRAFVGAADTIFQTGGGG